MEQPNLPPKNERRVLLLDDTRLSLPLALAAAIEAGTNKKVEVIRQKENELVEVEEPKPHTVLDHEGLILRKRPEVRRYLRMVRSMLKRGSKMTVTAQINHLASQDCCRAEPWPKTSEKLMAELQAAGKLEDKYISKKGKRK